MDSVTILQQLIRLKSLTPNDAGCMEYIESLLKPLGFRFYYFDRNNTRNMYAEIGEGDTNFCFAGHTDVVPVGDETSWKYPPFEGVIDNGRIYGRGTSDMKGGIAAFIAAVLRLKSMPKKGKISLLLTSDEEGPALDGIQYALPLLEEKGLIPTLCLVGEPTNPSNHMGGFIKVGRRASFNAKVKIKGTMGHVAYPESAKNPHIPLVDFLKIITSHVFDEGTDVFSPTNLEVTNINSHNGATNVIPESVEVAFNIRFNTLHTKESLKFFIDETIESLKFKLSGYNFEYSISCDSNADYCSDPTLIRYLEESVMEILGFMPISTTKGATSDARFIQKYCPVVEFGLLTDQAHQIDEWVDLKSLKSLEDIYYLFLQKLF
ncbi:MAG: succinyl-diaminopimelate desuccinylase [Proteobacteria bacterium]|nr:succinyl-diaminopimelate desuccinylase [Pseudomonadota bacterium]